MDIIFPHDYHYIYKFLSLVLRNFLIFSVRLKKRVPAGLEFEYSYDFDDKGIIYYVATNGGREPYANPHTAGRIRVAASSVERYTHSRAHILSSIIWRPMATANQSAQASAHTHEHEPHAHMYAHHLLLQSISHVIC